MFSSPRSAENNHVNVQSYLPSSACPHIWELGAQGLQASFDQEGVQGMFGVEDVEDHLVSGDNGCLH